MHSAQLLAERGYHVLLQSVRGTFGSGGEFEPMRHEVTDGQDDAADLVPTRYEIGLDAAHPSCLLLPVGQAWK